MATSATSRPYALWRGRATTLGEKEGRGRKDKDNTSCIPDRADVGGLRVVVRVCGFADGIHSAGALTGAREVRVLHSVLPAQGNTKCRVL